jgi:hypothetical protein
MPFRTPNVPTSKSTSKLSGFLSALGTIGTPTGVVAIFCKILAVSDTTTAFTSLATMSIVAICLYREAINAHVPAALLLGLLAGLSAIFALNYRNILLKDTGLIRYYKVSNAFLSDMPAEIEHVTFDLLFFGTNFHISTGDARAQLLKKLSTGVRVRYLIFDVYSPFCDRVAKDFDQSPIQFRTECLSGLQSLVALRTAWQAVSSKSPHPGDLEIRFYNITPRARIYFFDPGRPEGRSYFVPYVNNINSPELPGFLLQNVDTGVYGDYLSGIEKLWQQSKTPDFDTYLANHPELTN